MFIFISVLIIIVSILLILIVLVQNSKGGGLTAGFSSSNQVMGVRRTTDFLEKATWTLATGMMVLSILVCVFLDKGNEVKTSKMGNQIENAIDASGTPQIPAALPPSPTDADVNP